MINHYLKLTHDITFRIESKRDNASLIARYIHEHPLFSGNLVLRGSLANDSSFGANDFVKEELAKIKSIDVTNMTNLRGYICGNLYIPCDFIHLCSNIKEYKGISKMNLLRTDLNISNIDFSNVEIDIEDLIANNLMSDRELIFQLKVAIQNGASIKHFNLTRDFTKRHSDLTNFIKKTFFLKK